MAFAVEVFASFAVAAVALPVVDVAADIVAETVVENSFEAALAVAAVVDAVADSHHLEEVDDSFRP